MKFIVLSTTGQWPPARTCVSKENRLFHCLISMIFEHYFDKQFGESDVRNGLGSSMGGKCTSRVIPRYYAPDSISNFRCPEFHDQSVSVKTNLFLFYSVLTCWAMFSIKTQDGVD